MGNCTSSPMFISRIVPTMLFCATVVSILYNVLFVAVSPAKDFTGICPTASEFMVEKIE